MKKLLICFLILLSGVFGVTASVGFVNQAQESSEVLETIANLDTVDAAVANTSEVQKRLKKWGYYTGAVDGINGPKTIAAVKKFQKRYGRGGQHRKTSRGYEAGLRRGHPDGMLHFAGISRDHGH